MDGRFIDRHTGVLCTPAGLSLGRVWFFRDITERKQAEAEILRTSRSDILTGLANRAVFMEAVEQAIAHSSLDYLRLFPADRIKIAQALR
jgi:predicted signal transduction protein with EAL and GGDEF domain